MRITGGATFTLYCQSAVVDTEEILIDEMSTMKIISDICSDDYWDGSEGLGSYDGGGGEGGPAVGVGGAGGNGGYTGMGGSGSEPYGSAEDFIAVPGSCGGSGGGPFGAAGGIGGGALTLIADTANIKGKIHAEGGDGEDAPYDDGGGGGGPAGSVVIMTDILNVVLASTLFSVRGGAGGNGGTGYAGGGGGGGGGGGSVELNFNQATIQSLGTYYPNTFAEFATLMKDFGCFEVSGGPGGPGGNGGKAGQPGQPGAVNESIP